MNTSTTSQHAGYHYYDKKATHHSIHSITEAGTEAAAVLVGKEDEKEDEELTEQPPLRILHIVTALAEYNDGSRKTQKGEDRFGGKVLPVLKHTLESIVSHNKNIDNKNDRKWEVDVYLILGFTLTEQRRQFILKEIFPQSTGDDSFGIGLEVWDDAIPLGYGHGWKGPDKQIELATHALARQHRFVIKDKLEHYDFFSAWEDDMVVTKDHIENFLEMTHELEELKKKATSTQSEKNTHEVYGDLDQAQLDRLIPGFIRVEVFQHEEDNNKSKYIRMQKNKSPIPVKQSKSNNLLLLSHDYCCEYVKTKMLVKDPSLDINTMQIDPEQIVFWETEIKAMGLRKIPSSSSTSTALDWVAFLPSASRSSKDQILSYWSGNDGAFGLNEKRPGRDGKYMGQQAGLMATREQIKHFDKNMCPGGFLPPFTDNFWHDQAGLRPQNVEFWSGGFQLFSRCFMQRFISLDKDRFSKQLLYHSSDNKQSQLGMSRFTKAQDLLGQLHSVKDKVIEKYGLDSS